MHHKTKKANLRLLCYGTVQSDSYIHVHVHKSDIIDDRTQYEISAVSRTRKPNYKVTQIILDGLALLTNYSLPRLVVKGLFNVHIWLLGFLGNGGFVVLETTIIVPHFSIPVIIGSTVIPVRLGRR